MAQTDFSNARVLVVGGAGFVGSNLVHQILDQGPREIIVVDNLLSSDVANIPADARVRFVFGSITDERILAGLPEDLDYAFHLACFHGNQSSIADPFADHENNTLTSLKLFDRLSRIANLKKVVYAAAACAVAEKTYDAPTATTEEQPVTLYHDSPYSISKIIGELYGNYYFQRSGLPIVKARFSNVYGPREILGAGQWRGTVHTVWRNVTPTFVFRALHGEALRLEGGGRATRDFIYVEDVAEGLLRCAAFGEPGGVYNIASGVETSIRALADAIVAEAGSTTPHDIVEARDWDRSLARFGDPSKAKAEIGFAASTPLALGLERTVAWTRDNLAMIRACMARHVGSVPEVARYLDEGASR
jgi:nucleoside-diphosphate-sugar epimerase